MTYEWKDLQGKMNCFTVRNATMFDLNTKKPVRCYSANTRITIVQKCVTGKSTLYRTGYAKENGLDWAFEASAFGLPNDIAPLAHKPKLLSNERPDKTPQPDEKQTEQIPIDPPTSGEEDNGKELEKREKMGLLRRLFRRNKV